MFLLSNCDSFTVNLVMSSTLNRSMRPAGRTAAWTGVCSTIGVNNDIVLEQTVVALPGHLCSRFGKDYRGGSPG
jgi:hypothetical protein